MNGVIFSVYKEGIENEMISIMAANYEKSLVKTAIERLYAGEGTGLILLKVIYCNAHLNSSFAESFCEVEPESDTLFYFLSIFRRGVEVLKKVSDTDNSGSYERSQRIGLSLREKEAVQKLLGFLDKIGAIGKQLAWRRPKTELEWTLQLCKHLLQELGPEEYIVSELSRDLGQVGSLEHRMCPCCQERLIGGSTDNTYLGHCKVWHGDLGVVLLGPNGDTAMPVKIESSQETKYGKHPLIGQAQVIAQSFVFSHFMKKIRPNLSNFLIPTITFNRNQVLFTFYDPVEDMLIQSESMNLFDYDGNDVPEQLRIDTVVAVWLVLNYRLFCSGVCLDMKETGFKANVLVGKPEALKIYNEDLVFGKTMQSETLQSFARSRDGVYTRIVKGDN